MTVQSPPGTRDRANAGMSGLSDCLTLLIAVRPIWRDPETGYVRQQVFVRSDRPIEIVEAQLPAGRSVVLPASTYAHIRQAVWVMAGELAILEGRVMQIIQADFRDPRVIELLRIHLASARAETAPGSAHALDLPDLQSSDINFWAIWDGETLLGVGALKRLSPEHGEVKSMHIAQSKRRMGAGSAILRHIIAAARESGLSRLSLETGSWEYFRPARTLYRKYGFVECPPFANYVLEPNSVFMSLDLRTSRS